MLKHFFGTHSEFTSQIGIFVNLTEHEAGHHLNFVQVLGKYEPILCFWPLRYINYMPLDATWNVNYTVSDWFHFRCFWDSLIKGYKGMTIQYLPYQISFISPIDYRNNLKPCALYMLVYYNFWQFILDCVAPKNSVASYCDWMKRKKTTFGLTFITSMPLSLRGMLKFCYWYLEHNILFLSLCI